MMDRGGEVMSPGTMCEAFQATAAARRDRVTLRTHGDGVQITWGEYAERVGTIAADLHALGLGRGDRLALMLINRPRAARAPDWTSTRLGKRSLPPTP